MTKIPALAWYRPLTPLTTPLQILVKLMRMVMGLMPKLAEALTAMTMMHGSIPVFLKSAVIPLIRTATESIRHAIMSVCPKGRIAAAMLNVALAAVIPEGAANNTT